MYTNTTTVETKPTAPIPAICNMELSDINGFE